MQYFYVGGTAMNESQKQMIIALDDAYGQIGSGLDFTNAFELLIATILSAQSTDKRVNLVTPVLFAHYPTPEAMLTLKEDELSAIISSIGLYRNKSKHILATCRTLVDDFDGEVPKQRKDLESLPGVGRKTANVVLCNAFHKPAFAVDTHVQRVSNRLGFAHSESVVRTEQELMSCIPEPEWCHVHHLFIWHGRELCKARNPFCSSCFLLALCPYEEKVLNC